MLPNWIQVWREVRGGEKAYRFEGEAAAVRFFNGLACLERFGVPWYRRLEPATCLLEAVGIPQGFGALWLVSCPLNPVQGHY